MKRLLSLVLAMVCALSFTGVLGFPHEAKASDGSIPVYYKGERLTFSEAPYIDRGRVMLPLRAVCEGLGAGVYWNASSQTAHITWEGIESRFVQGATTFEAAGVPFELDVPLTNKAGRLYIPVRFLARALALDIEWHGETRSVTIDVSEPEVDEMLQPKDPEAIVGVWGTGETSAVVFDVKNTPEAGVYSVNAYFTHEGGIPAEAWDKYFPRDAKKPNMGDGLRMLLRYDPETRHYVIMRLNVYTPYGATTPLKGESFRGSPLVSTYDGNEMNLGYLRLSTEDILLTNIHADAIGYGLMLFQVTDFSPEAQAESIFVRAAEYWLNQ